MRGSVSPPVRRHAGRAPSGEQLGDSHAEARHGVAQIDRVALAVDVRLPATPADRGGAVSWVEHEHRDAAGLDRFQRLPLRLVEAVLDTGLARMRRQQRGQRRRHPSVPGSGRLPGARASHKRRGERESMLGRRAAHAEPRYAPPGMARVALPAQVEAPRRPAARPPYVLGRRGM